MPKTLSDDPEKRRLQIFQNIYQHYFDWWSHVQEHQITEVCVEGETITFHDLLAGLDDLPERQGQAFRLHILQGKTEVQSHRLMAFDSNYTTLVGQYAAAALKSMVAAYDRATMGSETA